ncbi:hypothetical protein BC829DRAFT_394547 [Chytridium lagenaria]|nr:hypothetical protein BC829DRAFT_394547 [Chytridium lagenaria]
MFKRQLQLSTLLLFLVALRWQISSWPLTFALVFFPTSYRFCLCFLILSKVYLTFFICLYVFTSNLACHILTVYYLCVCLV